MLQRMRENAQGLASKILVGIIIFVLALFGFGAFEAFVSKAPPVAVVNGEDITPDELAAEVERQRERILAELGENADPDLIDPTLLQSSVLDGLINRVVLRQAARDLDLGVSDADLDRLIVETPQFHTNGTFDAELFRRMVATNGHSPQSYRRELGANLLVLQLNSAISETALVTAEEKRDIAALLSQRRDVAYVTFDPARFTEDVNVTNEDVRAYYDEHPEEFATKESVDVAYVTLSVEDLMSQVDVTEDEVAERYQAEKANATAQEERRAAHILLEVNDERTADEAKAELEAIRQRVLEGEDFSEIARKVSEDAGSAETGGDLGFAAKGTYVPEFEEALWSLDAGELSTPVNTEFGVHLIQMLEKRTKEYPPFEEVQEELRARLTRERAAELFAERVRELDKLAFESPEGLEQIAETMALDIERATGITRENGPGLFADTRVREAAFAPDVLERGFNSPAVQTSDGTAEHAVVLRVTEHHPVAQRPFEEVQESVRARLVDEAARELARSRAEDMQQRLLAGEPASAVTEAAGVTWQTIDQARRRMPEVPPAVLDEAFELPRPVEEGKSVGLAALASGEPAVVIVTKVTDGDYTMLTENERRSLDEQLEQRAGDLDLVSFFETLRQRASIDRAS